jgi:hypothetical protein
MSVFYCPNCNKEHDVGNYPDHMTDLGPSGTFEFDCDCGATFDCQVDWSPDIYVDDASVVMRIPEETTLNPQSKES